MALAAIAMAMMAQGEPGGEFRPRAVDPYARCRCEAVDAAATVRFTGIVSDAELTAGEDGRTANPRQATIFRIVKSGAGGLAERVKVWHRTDPAQCGIRFDYGKRYDIVAVTKDGEFETDWCVMGKPRPPQ
jgi:hypothetical protein